MEKFGYLIYQISFYRMLPSSSLFSFVVLRIGCCLDQCGQYIQLLDKFPTSTFISSTLANPTCPFCTCSCRVLGSYIFDR
mmetsp:Transcript_39418/g.114101  ORF Transcript_39418/g.114101 Transcript_39418/m.114101 type:complete len:80 (+) Transcript_39418:2-241(+)